VSGADLEHHIDLATGEAADRPVSGAAAAMLREARQDAIVSARASQRRAEALQRLRRYAQFARTDQAGRAVADLLIVLGLEEECS
jgi:hypothetical protein